jgi:hypothetical protein
MKTNVTNIASRLRVGVAILQGLIGLAVVGLIEPASAFADPFPPNGKPAHPLAQHDDSTAIGWCIFGGLMVLVIAAILYLRSKPELAKKWANSKYRPYLWFAIAASNSVSVVQDVHAGKSFTWDLIVVIAAVFLGVHLLRQRRGQKG